MLLNLIVRRCFCYHEIDYLVSSFYVPGTIDAFNRQSFMNFSRMLLFKKTTVIKKACVSVNEVKPEK